MIVKCLGILCAAREALTLDELGAVAAWTADATRRTFLRGAQEILVETQRPEGQREYRLHHDSIRAHIAQTIGDVALRGYHRALAQRLATWPAPAQRVARRYALRHALIHRAEAGDWAAAWWIAGDTSFLEAKGRELGAHDVEADVTRVAERGRAGGDAPLGHRFSDLARALVRESHWLRAAPETTAAVQWNRLRQVGASTSSVDSSGFPSTPPSRVCGTQYARVRRWFEISWVTRAVVRACMVTPDGRRVVSGSDDKTLKVWDAVSGQPVTPPLAHEGGVTAVAWSPDGRRVATASGDQTARVWDVSWDTGTLADWRTAVERSDYHLNSNGVLVARAPKKPPAP